MRKILLLLIIITFSVTCIHKRIHHPSIYGNWYTLEINNIETTYDEVFINDTSFIYFSSVGGFIGPFKYQLINDSICYYYFSNNMLDTFYIKKINNKQFLFMMPENQTRLYNKIKVTNGEITLDKMLKYKYWDENEEYKSFLYSFYSRMFRELYSRGFTKDSVINMDFIDSLMTEL